MVNWLHIYSMNLVSLLTLTDFLLFWFGACCTIVASLEVHPSPPHHPCWSSCCPWSASSAKGRMCEFGSGRNWPYLCCPWAGEIFYCFDNCTAPWKINKYGNKNYSYVCIKGLKFIESIWNNTIFNYYIFMNFILYNLGLFNIDKNPMVKINLLN